jgi:CheY-like chemotaxis protein
MRILVVEDDLANRELLVELLQSRGHSAIAASDGHEALAALQKENFEIVFMDQEMPVMGGIETTQAIHRNIQQRRPIIVGMSGNVAEVDERRCLEAGMDAFLGKPIGLAEIKSVLAFFGHRLRSAPPEDSAPPPQDFSSEDLAAHLDRATGGNQAILRTLVKNFLLDAPAKLSALRRAFEKKDAESVASTAHSFKGSLAIFGAEKAVAAAHNLQEMGRRGDLSGAEDDIRFLENEFENLRAALNALTAAERPQRKQNSPRREGPRPGRKR